MALHRIWKVTIAGNRTFSFSNAGDLRPFAITARQDGTGNRTITWTENTNITWMTDDGNAPTPSAGANKYTTYIFIPLTATTWLGFLAGNN